MAAGLPRVPTAARATPPAPRGRGSPAAPAGEDSGRWSPRLSWLLSSSVPVLLHMAFWVPWNGVDEESRVGRRRGTDRCRSALFRRPPSEPCMQLSLHTALQWTGSRAGRHSASRLPSCPPAVRLLPFALWPAFPTAPVGRHPHDYYGSSVTLGLASRRPSRFPSAVDVRARRRCPVRPLEWAHCPSSTQRRVRASATLARYPGSPASDALQGTCPCITGD